MFWGVWGSSRTVFGYCMGLILKHLQGLILGCLGGYLEMSCGSMGLVLGCPEVMELSLGGFGGSMGFILGCSGGLRGLSLIYLQGTRLILACFWWCATYLEVL